MRLLQLRDYNVNLVTLHIPPPEATCPQVQGCSQRLQNYAPLSGVTIF